VQLFDRPHAEDGAEMLGTACVWHTAAPSLSTAPAHNSEAVQLAAIKEHMPAVEIFAVVCTDEQAAKDYPFTSAFYESAAYKHFRKQHFEGDLILPTSMAETQASTNLESATHLRVLWDARFTKQVGDLL